MMRSRKQVLGTLAVAFLVSLFVCGSLMAAEDRDNAAPVEWSLTYTKGLSDMHVKNAQGFRTAHTEHVRKNFKSYYVMLYYKNTGAHQRRQWTMMGRKFSEIEAKLKERNARLVDLEPVTVLGQSQSWNAVMVHNAGAQKKTWWYTVGLSTKQTWEIMKARKARIVDIERYGGGKCASIMVDNTGARHKDWWMYYSLTANEISQHIGNNKARLVDIDAVGTDRFDVIMVKDKAPARKWWWYVNVTGATIGELAEKHKAHPIDVTRIYKSSRYAVVLLGH